MAAVEVEGPYRALQEFMVAQQRSGRLLCLCSRNNEADVLEVLRSHPGMVLKAEHLVAWRINWLPKSTNLTQQQILPEYRELVRVTTAEFQDASKLYNRLLDEYLTASIIDLVRVKQSPVLVRGGYPLSTMLAGIALVSIALAIGVLGLARLFQKMRES